MVVIAMVMVDDDDYVDDVFMGKCSKHAIRRITMAPQPRGARGLASTQGRQGAARGLLLMLSPPFKLDLSPPLGPMGGNQRVEA